MDERFTVCSGRLRVFIFYITVEGEKGTELWVIPADIFKKRINLKLTDRKYLQARGTEKLPPGVHTGRQLHIQASMETICCLGRAPTD